LIKALLRLLPPAAKVTGHAVIDGKHQISAMTEREMRQLRGPIIGFVPQNPLASFNPLKSVGSQLRESWACHGRTVRDVELAKHLADSGIRDAAKYLKYRASAWSGGMLQRALIFSATALNPRLVLADEPTSAVDRPLALKMLELLSSRSETLLVITHDIDLVYGLVSRIVVMYAGTVVEDGSATRIIDNPQHPYTRALLDALPKPDKLPKELQGEPPSLSKRRPGCVFAPRCSRISANCIKAPRLVNGVACHHPLAGVA
jgi:peptide/nickel transport system ATP-binding protein